MYTAILVLAGVSLLFIVGDAVGHFSDALRFGSLLEIMKPEEEQYVRLHDASRESYFSAGHASLIAAAQVAIIVIAARLRQNHVAA